MKKTKILKIDVNLDINETNIFHNLKYQSNRTPQSSLTPTSVKSFSNKIPILLPNYGNNDTRTPKNKNIFEERKYSAIRTTTLKYRNNMLTETDKPKFRQTNKLINYTPLSVHNKIIPDKIRKSFDLHSKSKLIDSVQNDMLTSRNTKMPIIYNPISISTLLNYQHLPLDTNAIKAEYKNYEKSKSSNKGNNLIRSYAANTYQGILR
jgi:hypothetical protein